MDFWRLRSAGLLAALCLGLPAAQAYAPNSGSAVAGDLDAIAGPYGIPADKFQAATSSADASAAFYVTGYNVSSSSSMGNSPVAVTGWKLTARVKTDVSLSDASSGDEGTIAAAAAKQNKTQATTLYVEAPDGMTMGAQWRLCAVVYPGTTTTAAVDGTCKGVLSTECIQALTASAGASGPTGMDEQGNCSNFELPSRCTDSFPDGSGNLSAITINQTILDNKRFYAYGSDPTSADNSTAQAEARENVWPVVTIFGHVSATAADGTLSSANTAVQCVRARNGTAEDDIGQGSGDSPSSAVAAAAGLGGWAVTYRSLCAVFVTGWICLA